MLFLEDLIVFHNFLENVVKFPVSIRGCHEHFRRKGLTYIDTHCHAMFKYYGLYNGLVIQKYIMFYDIKGLYIAVLSARTFEN